MNDSTHLFDLTAADLMTPAVLTLPEEMSLGTAAKLLHRQQVSGAPVIDAQGRCTGVLSTTDFVQWASNGPRETRSASDSGLDWQMIDVEEAPGDLVRDYMTRDPVMVAPSTSIGRLVRLMIDAHIHRVIVVDSECRPSGIVSTTDILAAIARLMPPSADPSRRSANAEPARRPLDQAPLANGAGGLS